MRKIIVFIALLVMISPALALDMGYLHHNLQIVDELDRPRTDINSVTIRTAGSTVTQTIYKGRTSDTNMVQPMTKYTTNTTLDRTNGTAKWYGADLWDFLITLDSGINYTNNGHMSMNASSGRVIFPSYIGASASLSLTDANTLTFGTGADWVMRSATAKLLEFRPALDDSSIRVGLSDGTKSSDLDWYTGSGTGIFLDESANTLAITGVATTFSSLVTGTAGLTITGAAVNLNASSNFATNIGTGTTTTAVTIGGTTTQTVNVGASGTTTGVKTVTLGSNSDASITNLVGGTAGINIGVGTVTTPVTVGGSSGAQTIAVGDGAGVKTVSLGSSTGASSTAIKAGTGKMTIISSSTATDGLIIQANGAAGGIDIISLEDIDISTTGAAGEDISLTNTGGSINLSATENATGAITLLSNGGVLETITVTNTQGTSADAITLAATAGGVNIDAAAALDVTIDGGQVLLTSKQDVASAISLYTGIGSSETIAIKNNAGTGTDSINIDSTVGGFDLDTVKDIALTCASGAVAGEDILITQTGAVDASIILTAAGTGLDAIQLSATAGTIDIQGDKLAVDSTDDTILTVTSSTDGEDLLLVQSGVNNSSITLTAAGNGTDAIGLQAGAGGIDIDGGAGGDIAITSTAKSVVVTATEAVADAIALVATTGAGGITETSGSGGINLNASVSQPVNIASGTSTGTLTIGDGAVTQAVTINAGAGAKTTTLGSTNTTSATTINFGSGNLALTGAGVSADFTADCDLFSIDGTGLSNITVTSNAGSENFTVALAGATASSLILSSTGTGADALQITTSAGGIDITNGGAASGEDIDIAGQLASVNLTSAEAVTDAITLNASAGGITLIAGSGVLVNDPITLGNAIGDTVTVTGKIAGASPLSFDGSTANTAYTTLAVADVGSTITVTMPNSTSALIGSTLTTNNADAANSIWGGTNSLIFEGSTANDFETNFKSVDAAIDSNIILPAPATATDFYVVLSTLVNNKPDLANGVWLASNGIVYEGSGADEYETTISATNPTADRAIAYPDAAGTVLLTGRTGQQFTQSIVGAKLGSTGSGWVLAAADDVLLATLPASQTTEKLIIPVTVPLKVGSIITGFSINGQIESGGNAVDVSATMNKMTAAATDFTTVAIGTITVAQKTADYKIADANSTITADTVAADETFFVIVTGNTTANTDVAIGGITVTVTEP
jgi:hypothetical protein